jgi:ATP-dependent RNA helicase DeaD
MEGTTFAGLGLPAAIVEQLEHLGYEEPTPIQARTIPALLSGSDVLGQAQTGTGKTAAFSLPLLAGLTLGAPGVQALLLCPTRELATQVAESIQGYARRMGRVRVAPIYGGQPIGVQISALRRGLDVVVGTPGRVIDHIERGTLQLDTVRFVVLDEADEMLKMGFLDDVEKILSHCPDDAQRALFSATMPDPIARLARKRLRNPVDVAVPKATMTVPTVEQRWLKVDERTRFEILVRVLESETIDSALIFARTQNQCAEIAERLSARGFSVDAIHGGMNQNLRERTVRRLRDAQLDYVVATDVAARGIDVERITHVINFEIPYDTESYVHRIGRTGRAGRSGVAITLVGPRQRRMLQEIERYIGRNVELMELPTNAEIAGRRQEEFTERLRQSLGEDLTEYEEMVAQWSDQLEARGTRIAAAILHLVSDHHPLRVDRGPEPTPAWPGDRRAPRRGDRDDGPPGGGRDRSEGGRSDGGRPGPPRDGARPNDEGFVRMVMLLGRRHNLRPGDIVGTLTAIAEIPGRAVGAIDIHDRITFVDIHQSVLPDVMERIGSARIRGNAVELREARPDSDDGPRRGPSGPPRRGPPRGGPPFRGGGRR